MRGSDLLGLLRRLFGCLGAELILRPDRLKIGGAEMICNKGRIGQLRLAILSKGLGGWRCRFPRSMCQVWTLPGPRSRNQLHLLTFSELRTHRFFI
jgi:hypothetical protein